MRCTEDGVGGVLHKDEFARYVRDALANLYDPVHLQTSPLAVLLDPHSLGSETAGAALRELLREAIERLQPPATVPRSRPEWVGYRLLWLRFVQSVEASEVCEQLALSRASFYRRQQEAVEAVVSILWTRYGESHSARATQGARDVLSADQQARQEAVALARRVRRQAVAMPELLAGVQGTMATLAEQMNIRLYIETSEPMPTMYADPGVVRQIILNVLTEAIGLARGGTLRLRARGSEREVVLELCGLGSALGEGGLSRTTGFVVSRGLLGVYGGQLLIATDAQGLPVARITLPTERPQTVLIVDDNADTVDLYRRYLSAQAFRLLVARNSAEIEAHLAEGIPDVVLLDVLLPGSDGWVILQGLKTSPETAHLPVIVCSVLQQPQLALSLGAACVLRKPIRDLELLGAIGAVLGEPSEGE